MMMSIRKYGDIGQIGTSLLLILLFMIPSLQSEAAYCGQKLTTYQATVANGPDNSIFYNLINFWYQYPSNKSNCNDDQVYFSRTDFDQYLTLTTDFSTSKTDISFLKNENTTNKADITALKSDNTANKIDIASLKNDVLTLKNNAGSSNSTPTTYSYATSAQFYGLAFSTVVGLWFIASMMAPIISAVRHF